MYRVQVKVENGIRPAMDTPFDTQREAVRRAIMLREEFGGPNSNLDIRVFDGDNRQVWPVHPIPAA